MIVTNIIKESNFGIVVNLNNGAYVSNLQSLCMLYLNMNALAVYNIQGQSFPNIPPPLEFLYHHLAPLVEAII